MRINKKLVLVIFLGIQILMTTILKKYPEFVEQFYSNGLYVGLSTIMRYVFGWLPFSVGDILYTLAGIYIIRWLIINRKRIFHDSVNWLLDIGATISITYFTFHILWALNYYRQPINVALKIEADYSTEELIAFTERLIVKSNYLHNTLNGGNDSLKIVFPYSKDKIFKKVTNGYDNLAQIFPHLKYHPESLKKSIYSTPLTYMGFSGYLNPFTNEGQVDRLIPTYKFPTTACHEAAHQLGYAAENEANFIGCLAAINNNDTYFQYSGYTFALRYCMAEIYKRDSEYYAEIQSKINYGIIENYKEVESFWRSYENPFEPLFAKTFDNFLKANNQINGINSYNYVVALLVNYFKKREL